MFVKDVTQSKHGALMVIEVDDIVWIGKAMSNVVSRQWMCPVVDEITTLQTLEMLF